MEPASHPPTHLEELQQLTEGLWHLTLVLQPCQNPQPKEEPMHTTIQANSTMTLLQDIQISDRQDSSKLEDWFMHIDTTTDILTRSHTHIAEAKMCSLTHTPISGVLQAGKSQDTRSVITIICLIKLKLQCHFSALPCNKSFFFLQCYCGHFCLPFIVRITLQ